MLIRKSAVIILLLALHVGADVFRTNEIPVVPAEDLVPPPEDEESIMIRYQNQQQPSKSFLQRIVGWFGFNGDPNSLPPNSKAKQQYQKQQAQKQNGYVYENPAKPLLSQSQKFQQSPGFNQENRIVQSQQVGYTYEPPPPLKLQQLPQNGQIQNGYSYDPPSLKLQQQPQTVQPQTGYNYDPPPVKLQQLPQNVQTQNGYNYDPPPLKLQQQPQQQNGYNYDPPVAKLQQLNGYNYNPPPPTQAQAGYNYDKPSLKLQQRPVSLNDLVSSAASPTAVYTFNAVPQFGQGQSGDTFPCNKIPWMPMFPSVNELNLLRAKLQAKNPTQFQSSSGYKNIQPIARPTPEKFAQQLNAHTYLSPRQRPLRQPSLSTVNQINSLPVQSTAQPFRLSSPTTSTGYQTPQRIVLPVKTTQHNLVPIPVPNLSITPIPPLYDPKPFTLNNSPNNGVYINGRLVTPTGLSTTSVQSVQIANQFHPVTQSQRFAEPAINYGLPQRVNEPSTEYGAPQKLVEPATEYGAPQKFAELVTEYGVPDRIVQPTTSYGVPVTYCPPTNTYGTPPVRLTSVVTESSALSRFSASQPFTARPTQAYVDQTRLSSSNIEQNSGSLSRPIVISDNAADASESTRSPQEANTIPENDGDNQPIMQVLQELNVTTTPQGFHYPASTEQTLNYPTYGKRIENKQNTRNSIRGTPLDLLDTPNFRKINDSRVPEFKFIRNTWKPLAPNPFSTSSSPVVPSAASSAFQLNHAPDSEAAAHRETTTHRNKKIQIVIPYTSKNHPSPFKNNEHYQSFESSDGWSQSNSHDDFHNSEESQVISAATPSPKPKLKDSVYLTNILAKNIRELLEREHLKNLSTIDLKKLQKNIDGWTEQQFSMPPNRASTVSFYTQSKQIPFDYLTTTQAFDDTFTTESIQPTTEYPSTFDMSDNVDNTESNDSENEGEEIDEQTENQNENEIRGQEETEIEEEDGLQQAEQIEDDDFKRLDYLKSLENNHASGTEQRIFYATNPPAPVRTTTPMPPCSTTQVYETPVRTTVLPSPEELWNKLKSLLSPGSGDMREKVYVVTPQPYPFFESQKIVRDDDNEVVANFKSPRFLVRPTPGVSAGRSLNSVARLSFKPRASRLEATTVRTTWREPEPATEVFRSSTHSHSVVNGHAHAQAFSLVTPKSVYQEEEDEDAGLEDDTEYSETVAPGAQRRSLHTYKH